MKLQITAWYKEFNSEFNTHHSRHVSLFSRFHINNNKNQRKYQHVQIHIDNWRNRKSESELSIVLKFIQAEKSSVRTSSHGCFFFLRWTKIHRQFPHQIWNAISHSRTVFSSILQRKKLLLFASILTLWKAIQKYVYLKEEKTANVHLVFAIF